MKLLKTTPILNGIGNWKDQDGHRFDIVNVTNLSPEKLRPNAEVFEGESVEAIATEKGWTRATSVASPDILAKADEVFGQLPAEAQAGFAADYATVRVLIQAGRKDLAKAHIDAVEVPAEMQPLKDQLLAIFNKPAAPAFPPPKKAE